MRLFTPTPATIGQLQERDQRWYFSAAFPAVLRRHGVVYDGAGQTAGFVARSTPWREEFADKPLVFEGPLHETVARAFGVSFTEHTVEDIIVRTADGFIIARMVFPRLRDPRRDRPVTGAVDPLDARWDVKAFSIQEFHLSASDSPELLGETSERVWRPIAIRRGQALLLGAPILDVLARYDAIPPYARGYPGVSDWAHTVDLETWIVSAATELALSGGLSITRLRRWPHPFRWALTVRHDVDRALAEPARAPKYLKKAWYEREIRRRLRLYRRLALSSTWFWLGTALDVQRMRYIASRGQEVALHTEATSPDSLKKELERIQHALGTRVRGLSAHGGAKAPGHLGLHHIDWAMDANLEYGERIGGGLFMGPAIVLREGTPACVPFMLPGQHIGTESGVESHESNVEKAMEWLARVIRYGGHAVVMNHPDVHFDSLRTVLESAAASHPWNGTLAEVTSWGRVVQFAERTTTGVSFPSPLPQPAVLEVGTADAWSRFVIPKGALRVLTHGASAPVAISRNDEQMPIVAEPLEASTSEPAL